MRFLILFMMFFSCKLAADEIPKILHLTFHRGCKIEFEGVAKTLGINLETWFIPDLPPQFFDGSTKGNALYNIGHDRAENIWNLHKEYFETFDIILVSDTSPLCRIFIQNDSDIPLMIWICNRFDYCDRASLDCDFPDPEYYQLFNAALQKEKVKVFAYNAFEHRYAKEKGLNTGDLTITPCAPVPPNYAPSSIPTSIDKQKTFFLPPYHNEQVYMNLMQHCQSMGINAYCGRYSGPYDLNDFKAIIHLPYAWSNLALFENISLGIPYFIPSRTFFLELARQPRYFHPELAKLLINGYFDDSEWYSPARAPLFIYFDSWEDLTVKIEQTDLDEQRAKIKKYADEHRKTTLEQWKRVIDSLLGKE